MMRTVWTDLGEDQIELTDCTDDGERSDCFMWLCLPKQPDADAIYAFDVDDAESFAAVLLAWAKRQREGV